MKKLIVLTLTLIFTAKLFAADPSSVIDPSKLPNPFDGQNNIYQKIFDNLNAEYVHIGKRQADGILLNNKLSVTGGLNSIGLKYHQPFGEFGIVLDRNLAPAVLDAKTWIVTDTFTINIDASKVMKKLKDENAINIDEKNLAAYAGVVFKRTFTWVHFASSYEEGLTTHFEKLFFPFKAMTLDMIANLGTDEWITKEDSISFNAGGFVSTPVYPGVGVMGGVLASFQKMSRFEAVSMNGDHIQINFEKSKVSMGGASVAVQAMFLKVLKFTLLSYDFEYDNESSYKIFTDFKAASLKELAPNSPVANEVNQIIKAREGDLTVLAPYVISEETRISNFISHKYNFLLLGGKKSSKTEEIEIAKDGRVKTFFTHYYERVKYTEDLLSTIFSSILSVLTSSNQTSAKVVSDTRRVEMQYDSVKNLLESHQDLEVGSEPDVQKLTLNFTGEFMTKKTSGLMGQKYRDRAIFELQHYTGVDPLVSQMLARDYLQAPILIQGHYQVTTDGVRHLNALATDQVFDYFVQLCDDKPKNKFFNFRNLFSNCRRSLENDYINYLKDLSHNKVTSQMITECSMLSSQYGASSGKRRAFIKKCLSDASFKDTGAWTIVPLWPLKTLSQNIVNNSNSKIHFYNLFGQQNVFFYGSVDAQSADGQAFTSTFHEGGFKGFGAVDHYMRQENLRSPASVVIGQ